MLPSIQEEGVPSVREACGGDHLRRLGGLVMSKGRARRGGRQAAVACRLRGERGRSFREDEIVIAELRFGRSCLGGIL